MRDNPWVAIPLIDSSKESKWFPTEVAALKWAITQKDEGYDIQYRPGRKVKK
jgi:hypothetical protein